MRSALFRLLFQHWPRKLISLLLAMILWMVVHHSMTVTKTLHNIPVRIVHLQPGKTVEGMQTNGLLNQKISLMLTGHKEMLEELSDKDFEVLIEASETADEWIATISKKNLSSLNPELDLGKIISKVHPFEMILRQSKRVVEKIPVLVTQPIGEAPKGYQFLDVWPYRLSLTLEGPEDSIKQLKSRGLQLSFNLNDISKEELDALFVSKNQAQVDEVSFFVPSAWKKVFVPQLSDTPVEIDDPQAKTLRIDFSRQDLLPIGASIPITVFYPPKYSQTLNPETYQLALNEFIAKKNGIKMITTPLFAQGVSRLFLEIVKDMLQVVVIAMPKSERESLVWNVQFSYPHELEDRYVARVMSEAGEETDGLQPHLREDYLRNRFRSYMNRFRLYTPNGQKLNLKIELQANAISVLPLQ